MILFNF